MKKSLFFLLATIMFGCGKNDTSYKIEKATVKNAQLIYAQQAISRAGNDYTGYVSMDARGNINPIRFINEHGDSVDMFISRIRPANNNYLLFEGDFYITGASYKQYSYLFVDKQTELLWALPVDHDKYGVYFNIMYRFCTDENNDIYFSAANKVFKVNTSHPGNLTMEDYTPDKQTIESFNVSAKGTCAFSCNTDGIINNEMKFKCKGGSIHNIKTLISDDGDGSIFRGRSTFVAPDGQLHVVNFWNPYNNIYDINVYRIEEIGDNELHAEKVGSIRCPNSTYHCVDFYKNPAKNTMLFSTKEELIEFDPVTGIFNRHTMEIPDFNMDEDLHNSKIINTWITNDALFSINNDIIYCIDLRSLELKTLDILACGFEIKPVNVTGSTSTGSITFSGIRYSDGATVMGEVSDDLQITIYPLTFNYGTNITSLVKLN